MTHLLDFLLNTAIVGLCATLVMDAWSWLRQPLLGVAPPNYALVGRWVRHMGNGQFRHPAIAQATAMPHEAITGWAVHYLVGLGFAGALLLLAGPGWLSHPTLWPALLFGLLSVAAPFLLMQPGMGAGLAARRTPNPRAARLQSLLTHTVFGAGLYLGGWVAHALTH
ncbi:MAG: DUF2938 domain-containing protein [Pseudomonadota bacterium]|uniref:DUF2938 domain-containing protein n=1 Tax=Alcanivorax profundi TaxID=2338368 RepID=UPI0018F5C744|nr:DUF2938 domain-containing protein [Alcanivorax profundi]MED5431785.1 DUF2938 domain-containing protein [Pseudomonadota bacterium]